MSSKAIDSGTTDLFIASGPAATSSGGSMADVSTDTLVIAGARREIVFIEDNVADYQAIAANAGAGRQVVILDSTRDGLQQIADAVKGMHDIDALHVVTHGAQGRIGLGSLTLDAATAAQHKELLAAIGSSMAADGDMLFYGCDVGAGAGAELVGQLALATGADVAASDDPTGDAGMGGDWDLEVASGAIEAAPLVDAALAAQYRELLAITTPTTITFQAAPPSQGHYGAGSDVTYAIPGHPGYSINFNGYQEGVGSYLQSAGVSNEYISFAGSSMETGIRIAFSGGKLFTPTSVKLNGSSSVTQTLTFTGLRANGTELTRVDLEIPGGGRIEDFVTKALSGFTNIAALVITPRAGQTIKYFQMDDLVLANVTTPDTTPPTLAITSNTSTVNASATANITFTFSEDPGSSFTLDDVTVTNGSLSALGGSGLTRTAVFTPAAGVNGASATITVAASRYADAAGNANTTSSSLVLTVDTVGPNAPSAPDLGAASDSGGWNNDNITNNNTGLVFTGTAEAGVTTVKLFDTDGVTEIAGTATVSGGNYSITTTGTLSNGSHTITARAFDAAGNASSASSGVTVMVDRTAPAVSISSSNSSLKTGDTAVITFTFTEDPGASFSAADLSVSGGSLGTLTSSGLTRTATFTPNANVNNGSASVSVTAGSYVDAAGNSGTGATSAGIAYDTMAPTVSITSSKSTLKAGETATITFTFSEDPGSSFTWNGSAGDVVVSGGTLSAISGSGTTRTATFTPAANANSGTASITVASGTYVDTAGNLGGAGTTPSITFDTLAPTLAITSSRPTLKIGETATITFTFSEDPGSSFSWDGSIGDIVVTGGTLSAISGSGLTRTATFTPTADTNGGVASITVAPGAYADAATNAGAAGATPSITFDTLAPNAPVMPDLDPASDSGGSSIDNITNGTALTVRGAPGSAEAGATIRLYQGAELIATTTATGSGSWQVGGITLDEGMHTISATATDAAGNTGSASAGLVVTVDRTPPAAPSMPDLAPASDSGSDDNDNVTNANTPTFMGAAGSAAAGATVRLYDTDGTTVIATTTAAGDGSWSVTASALSEGAHTITARAFDAAGNQSAASSGLAVTIDRTAPATTVASAAFSDDTGASAMDMVTAVAVQTVSGTLSANLGAGERVEVSLDNGASWSVASATAGANTWSIAATLAGSGTLRVRVVDAAGNAGPAFAHAYTLDTTAPSAPSAPDLIAASDSGASNSDNITGNTTPTFSGTAEAGATVTLYDGATVIGSAVATGGSWSITSAALAQGSHTITAKATDIAGNESAASSALTVHIETGAPATVVTGVSFSADTGSSAADLVTRTATQTITGTQSAALAVGERVEVSLDGGASWNPATAATGSSAWSLDATLASGTHRLVARVVNAVDNAGPLHQQDYTLDTTAPAVTISSNVSQLKAGESATITFTFSEDPGASFSWDGSAGDVTVSGGTLGALSGSGLVRTAVFTPDAGTNAGTASITISAGTFSDLAGNAGGSGGSPSLVFDTLAPAAPSVPVLAAGSDSGTSDSDGITNDATPTFTGTAERGATVTLYDSHGAEIGSGIADAGSGAWSITATTLAQGAHTVTARARDAAGNTSAASTGQALTIDSTAPTLAITSSTPSLRIDQTATITFTFSEDPGASFTAADIAVSGGTLGALSGTGLTRTASFTPAAGTNGGTASIFVASGAYADAAGNVGGPGAMPSITFDTLAPGAPGVPELTAASDSGSSATDGLTNAAAAGFRGAAGSAEAGAAIRLYAGATLIATTTATGNGSWLADDIVLAEGTHTITATATDAAGNTGAASAGLVVTVDRTAPAAPALPDLVPTSDSGSSDSDNVTTDDTPTFMGAAGSAAAGATVRLYDTDGTTVIATTTAAGDGSWSVTAGTLSEGAHTITARAVDAAGNESAASSSLALTIDRSAPGSTGTSVSFSSDTGVSSTDMVTANPVQTVSGTLSANLGSGERVEVSLDNGASWNPVTATAGTNTWSTAATLAGSDTLRVRVVDAAGNAGPAFAHAYTLDTTAPGAPSAPDLAAASDSGVSNSDNITGDTTPTFSGTAEAGATVTLYDGATVIGSAVATGGTWSITSAALAQGSHTITAKATDIAGNESAASSALTVHIETGAPATVVTGVSFSADTGSSAADLVTRTAAQTITGTLSAALAAGERVEVSLDNGSSWNVASAAAGTSSWSLAGTLASGTHTLVARVVNAVENAGPLHQQDYTLDTTAPAVTISSNVSQLKAGESATITFTFNEDPGASFSWDGSAGDVTVSGGTLGALSGSGLVRTALFTPDAGTNAGTASITISAGAFSDLAGNAGGSGSSPSLVFDTLAPAAPSAPVLAAGSDSGTSNSDGITNDATPTFTGTAERGATVTLYDSHGAEIGSGIADAGSGAWSITATTLAQGAHTVTARARDAAGNTSAASTGQALTIDSTAPTLAITSSTPTLRIDQTATITFTFSEDPGASFTDADIVLSGGTLGPLSGSGLTRSATFTPTPGVDGGTASISAGAGAYQDAAGNAGGAGLSPALVFDTLAPLAPSTPALAAASDTGTAGDGVTSTTTPVIEGSAAPNAAVVLYDGTRVLGNATADAQGKWSVAAALAVGNYSLSATQLDAAGNASAHSTNFVLRIEAPPAPPADPLVDGVPVQNWPVSLPGGVNGNAVQVPVVGAGRVESSGKADVADIPLATSGGANLLLAQLAPGFGLGASGANVSSASATELLIASIKAATPSHAPHDQGHLTGNGQAFLAGLASSDSLLVQTLKPVSTATPGGALTLQGSSTSAAQSVALVIDASGLQGGGIIELQHVDFAAIIGSADVVARSGSPVLAGDGAAQRFTVAADGASMVFAGGGQDTLGFGIPAAPVTAQPAGATTMLHGGQAGDTAVFLGARSDFDIERHHGYVVVSSKAEPDARAVVVNVETLQFSNGSVAVENAAGLTTLAGMYQTVFGRQADLGGFEYWADTRDAGASWGAIALHMIASSESGQGFNGNAAHDIALLYQALFDRQADSAGLAYWTDVMARGASLELIATSMVESAEMVGHRRAVLDWDFSV